MPAIDSLLQRFGFVRIARYGLVLTPEGRIMSLRPTILDDGLGGRIVGWPDGDLAAMELQKWEPARPASMAAVATRLAALPPPMPRFSAPIAPTVAPIPTVARPAPAIVVPQPPPAVAEPAQVEEDEWEWEIALARARVAAEEAELAAQQARSRRRDTVPPPVAEARPLVVQIPPVERPRTEPMIVIEDRTSPSNEIVQVVRLKERPAAPAERPLATPVGVRKVTIPPKPETIVAAAPPAPRPAARQARPGTSPPTIIPIPKLPSIKDRTAQIQPVVSAPRNRFAKGTGPVIGTQVGAPPPPPLRSPDEEKTSPGMSLPVAARAITLPRIKPSAR